MMLVLDTDHLTEFQKGTSPEAHRLKQRLTDSADAYATMDLKIASICLSIDATLLSRNLNDFANVPGLRVEDWLS